MGGAEERTIQEFVGVTDAPLQVARHILEAHGWDLDTSVSFYIESGGVGHGAAEDMACSPPGHELQPTEDGECQHGARARQRGATQIMVRVIQLNEILDRFECRMLECCLRGLCRDGECYCFLVFISTRMMMMMMRKKRKRK